MVIAFAIGRSRRQSILPYVFLGERNAFNDGGVRSVVFPAELAQSSFERFGD